MSAFYFNDLLERAGVDVAPTLLLRHQKVVSGRPTPYSLWHDDRAEFERFQSYQSPQLSKQFSKPLWASFVVEPDGSTLFAGLYQAKLSGEVPAGLLDPVTGLIPGADKDRAHTEPYHLYACRRDERLSELTGRLVVDWGQAHRSWWQYAANQNKPILELRKSVSEPPFPGHLGFVSSLSAVASLPSSWKVALASVRGIYLLTCPRSKEQYVGLAGSAGGFLARWMEYVTTGHGGNVGLRQRDPSDYHVSILEVLGSSVTHDQMLAAEQLWKRKLRSREMGLNRNL